MRRKNVADIDNEPDEYHDLIDVVIVRRGGKPENGTIFDYIDAVYANDVERVEKYTDIGDNQNIRKELGDIMTASQTLIAQGIEQGVKQGQNALVDAIMELRSGKTPDDLFLFPRTLLIPG